MFIAPSGPRAHRNRNSDYYLKRIEGLYKRRLRERRRGCHGRFCDGRYRAQRKGRQTRRALMTGTCGGKRSQIGSRDKQSRHADAAGKNAKALDEAFARTGQLQGSAARHCDRPHGSVRPVRHAPDKRRGRSLMQNDRPAQGIPKSSRG